MLDENVKTPTTNDYKFNPQLSYLGIKTSVELNGRCLKRDKITYNHEKVVNNYIVCEITKIKTLKTLLII